MWPFTTNVGSQMCKECLVPAKIPQGIFWQYGQLEYQHRLIQEWE
jgi:hypothetical protein